MSLKDPGEIRLFLTFYSFLVVDDLHLVHALLDGLVGEGDGAIFVLANIREGAVAWHVGFCGKEDVK